MMQVDEWNLISETPIDRQRELRKKKKRELRLIYKKRAEAKK